jgi:FkbM family methyltransferase
MKKAALICVTRNNAEKLQTTLNSIIQNTKPEDYDLIIIDNASSDAKLGIYQQSVLAEHITIVRSGKNLNWVGGINLGLEMTRGYQYVGFLNDDIEVCPNWLENFFDVLDCNPDVAAVGPLTSNTRDWQGYDNVRSIFLDWKLPELQEIDRKEVFMMYEHLKNNGSGIKLKGTLSLFCILLKRSLVDQIGLVHPEFIEKLRLAGYCFALSARTYVSHDYNAFSWEGKLFQNSYHSRSFIKKTWVINLERRRDRLDRFKRDNPGLPELHVLKAYDGKKIRLSPKIARLFSPNTFNWNKATIGCSLSHLEIWTRLSKEPDENACYLILEDDTRLSPDWRETLERTFSNGQVPDDWDVLYLGGVLPKHENNFIQCKEIVSGNIFRVAPNNFWFWQEIPDRYFHFGAYAYLLSKKGAIKLMEIIMLNQGISLQADFLLAYPVQLKRYFFDPFLAHCYQDIEAGFKKSYSEESHREGILDSDIWQVSDCFEESIANAMVSISEPCDICGALEEARKQMQVPSNTQNIKISLLHATRSRPIQALNAKELWLKKAKFPERVEHLFAIDHDDAASIALKQHTHVIQLQDGYSVGAWNLAASKCTGDILIQLSDDWLPPDGWDELIVMRLNLDSEEVLWIDDGNRKDDLMCMAILTRKYYLRHGLFDPIFKNVYSDNDFTLRAKKAGAVVDARDIQVKHEHPLFESGKSMDATYERGNQSAEYDRAKAIFEAKHFPTIYSQNDEQVVIERFFGGAPGVLWDFGCNDGITLSNSHHLLTNKGWKGVLVDASPVCVEKAIALYEGRQDIQILNIGLGERNGVLDFYESGTHLGKGDLSLVSSFKKESTQRWEPTTEYQVKQVQVCDFKTFLDDHALYKTADFITIDIEGLDFEILSSIDLNQTQTRLVCVEHNGHDIQKYIVYCRKFGMEVISQNAENLLIGKIKCANVR